MSTAGSLTLRDGRRLAFADLGDPGGQPVLLLHGTPGSRLQLVAAAEPADRLGLRLVVPDRPGFGQSTHDPRRRLASWSEDAAELANHVGLDGFVVAGLSGGGPHALAVGHALGDRIRSVVTVGGVGPLVPRDPALPGDRLAIRVARRTEVGARLLFGALLRVGRRNPERALERFAGMLADVDRELLMRDTPVRAGFLADLAAPAPTAARASALEFRCFASDWGFPLEAVSVPVHVWHGSADRNVPVEHAAVIAARCPAARRHVVPGGGHLLLASHAEQILGGLD